MIYSIVVTYNGAQWIEKCLSSLIDSTVTDHHILVVDNNSTDSTVSIINQDFTDVELLEQKENLGFGKANNIGMKMALDANADFVFLLNQDAWVERTSIEELVKVQQSNSEYGILSPIHMNGEGDLIDYKVFENLKKKAIGRRILSDSLLSKLNSVYDVKFINAAVWLISKDCLTSVGLFDSLFFHYGEDVNYAQRVNFHRFNVGVVPSSVAYHDREVILNQGMLYGKYKVLRKAFMYNVLCDITARGVFNSYFRFCYYSINQFLDNLSRVKFRFAILDLFLMFSSIFHVVTVCHAIKRAKSN